MNILILLLLSAMFFFSSCTDVPFPDYSTGSIRGQVSDEVTGNPLADVLITTSPGSSAVLTGEDGKYEIETIAEGQYTVTALKDGYNKAMVNISVEADQETEVPIVLKKKTDERGSIRGTVYDLSGSPLVTASISTEPGVSAVVSDDLGNYTISDVPEGDYTITAKKPHYSEQSISIHVVENEETIADFVLAFDPEENHNPSDLYYFSPPNNERDVDIENTDLQWSCSDPDGDELTYDVYLWKSGDNFTLVAVDYSGTTYDPGTLENATNYLWMIVAKDGYGGFKVGPIWSFTTQS